MAMQILIVDDEKPARERLQRLVSGLAGYETAGEAENGREAIEQYNKLQPEIVLLDIRMPVMDGLEAAKHLIADETPPAVIFTTAYNDHAIEAFETHACDYLLKPVRKERLLEALQSASRQTKAQLQKTLSTESELNQAPRQNICVRHRGSLLLIPIDDIICMRAADKYVTLHHVNGEALTEESLIQLEQEFGDRFLRVHRNSLISRDRFSGLEKQNDGSHSALLRDSEIRIEVSRRHLPMLRKLLKN